MKHILLSLLIIILTFGLAPAQKSGSKSLTSLKGPVKSFRSEVAEVISSDNGIVTGPAVLTGMTEINEDGTKLEATSYEPDGSVHSRTVYYYHPDGKGKETLTYLGESRLVRKTIYHYKDGDNRTEFIGYGEDGAVVSREVHYLDTSRTLIRATENNDKYRMKSETVVQTNSSGQRVEIKSVYVDGQLTAKAVTTVLNREKYEEKGYDAAGLLTFWRVTTCEQGQPVLWEYYDKEGKLIKTEYQTREKCDGDPDRYGNCTKSITLRWNAKNARMEPIRVAYLTIIYYE